jgi:hypothetical protein
MTGTWQANISLPAAHDVGDQRWFKRSNSFKLGLFDTDGRETLAQKASGLDS